MPLRADLYLTGSSLLRVCLGPNTDPGALLLAERVADFARRAGAGVVERRGQWSWIVEVELDVVARLHQRIAVELERVGCTVVRDEGPLQVAAGYLSW